MKSFLRFLLFVAILAGIGAASYQPVRNYWKEYNRPAFRFAEVARGEIVSVVNSTGTVKPVLSVSVGSFVSGPIKELSADFNTVVKKDDLLATVDPRLFEANVARDEAFLATQKAQVIRAEAQLQQAINDEKRALALRADNANFISPSEIDKFKFNRMSLEAELTVAKAGVAQAEATLRNSQANLDYTQIRSPVDGVVIDRKIDPGQTLASQFQTPELFVVAPDLRKEIYVHASVDETDIGLIREAKERGCPVHFTVDAYPDDLFEGTIAQIRMSSTTTQDVVTYPVIVSSPNPDLKLIPGMTASISFQIHAKQNVLKIPNAALRFYPELDHVRPEDRRLLQGTDFEESDQPMMESQLSADEKAAAHRNQNQRYVWVLDGDFLRAVNIVTGISDYKYTEMVEGNLTDGQKLVTSLKPREYWGR